MRRLGWVLLLVGYGWLLACQAGVTLRGVRPALRATLVELDRLPGKSYSKQEVEDLLRAAAIAQNESTPVFALPGTLMLAGALLCVGRRRRTAQQGAA